MSVFPREIPSAVTDAEALQLQELALDLRVLEMGAHYGFSTVALAQSAAQLHSVDWHMGDPMAGEGDNLIVYRDNLRRYGKDREVITHCGRFEDVLPSFKTSWFDGAFLDGNHDRASVDRDTTLMLRVVKPGGWLAWHDYGRFDVKEVVDEFVTYLKLTIEVVDHLAWTRKP